MQVFLDSSVGAWLQNVALRLSPVDVLCILGAMVIMHVCRYAGMWVYALTALPGTVAHELAHFSVAFVLGARPAFPSLVPVRTQRSWRLGSVAFRVGHARALPIAMAPLLLAPLALWWAAALLHPAVPRCISCMSGSSRRCFRQACRRGPISGWRCRRSGFLRCWP